MKTLEMVTKTSEARTAARHLELARPDWRRKNSEGESPQLERISDDRHNGETATAH